MTSEQPDPSTIDSDVTSVFHQDVLSSMSEGVLTVDSDGRIEFSNPAASDLLGLESTELQGKTIAEVLLKDSGLEAFSDAVLAAVYEEAIGTRTTVCIQLPEGLERYLAVTTSYLNEIQEGNSRRTGVVAVFEDVSEIERLRVAEKQLVDETQEQNDQLREAYREIEEKNNALDAVLKKVTVVRFVAISLVVILFTGSAWYVWSDSETALPAQSAETVVTPIVSQEGTFTTTVEPRRLTTTLSFIGTLAPRQEIHVTSPIAGKVSEVLFKYGSRITVGQPLVELDTAETSRQYRTAQATFLEAQERHKELENWEHSLEMARANRAVTRARLELVARENRLSETALLLERGIVPASEHRAAQRQYDAQQLSYESAVQDRDAVQSRGDADSLRIAQLRLENATTNMQELEKMLEDAVVRAPASGVVLEPTGRSSSGTQGGDSEQLARGNAVTEGGYLLTVGDLDGFSVTGTVDEVDVTKLRIGQLVRISGDAFPDIELDGHIERISQQSQRRGSNNVPTFQVTAVIDQLNDVDPGRLRLGMSANVVVVLRDEPQALLVPLAAVQGTQGNYWVQVQSEEDGKIERSPVEVGTTTLNEVEVTQGLEVGDIVLVQGY